MGRGLHHTPCLRALPGTHRAMHCGHNNTVINSAMAFSRQRKYRHDKSKLIFHDCTCCLIIVCHGEVAANEWGSCRERGWLGEHGGAGTPLDLPPPSPCVGCLSRCRATLCRPQGKAWQGESGLQCGQRCPLTPTKPSSSSPSLWNCFPLC